MSSQIPYLEQHVGPPNVITLDITNITEVAKVLHETSGLEVRVLTIELLYFRAVTSYSWYSVTCVCGCDIGGVWLAVWVRLVRMMMMKMMMMMMMMIYLDDLY